ncbi:hypothetical protein [Salibacterium aidingense]|uniref:hypothetical protein n=1 Tax=Salibacterium aidingense TaxID=384933 RepID=UPI0003FF6C10|nr:hypothetical protein [Salibacterium aidingense]
MKNKTFQIQFVIFGFLFLLFSTVIGIAAVSGGVFPLGHDLVLFGVSVMAFCNAYLYPQFKENDERTKQIREKGMFVSYFFILSYMLVLMGLFQFQAISLSGYQTVSLLAALTMMTVFLSFVVTAKRT